MKLSLGLIALSVVNFIAVLVAVLLLGNNVPIHFNSSFEVIKMGSPAILLLIAVIPVFCGMGLLIDSKIRVGALKNKKLISIVLYSVAIIVIYINWLMVGISSSSLSVGHKLSLPVDLFVYIPIGIFMVIVGLLIRNFKQRNRFFGAELTDETENKLVWERAHKLCGKMLVISGSFIVLSSIVAYLTEVWWISVVALVIGFVMLTAIPISYAGVVQKLDAIEADEKIKELKKSGIKDSEVKNQKPKKDKEKKDIVEINESDSAENTENDN